MGIRINVKLNDLHKKKNLIFFKSTVSSKPKHYSGIFAEKQGVPTISRFPKSMIGEIHSLMTLKFKNAILEIAFWARPI